MGWLTHFLEKISGEAPADMILVSLESPKEWGDRAQPIEADECYIELYVESLRLARARVLASTFHGVVYSFVSLAREAEPTGEFAAVSKPDKLTALDKGSLDKVITVSKQMMGAVPWRGGVLSLELGLFSVKSGNLLTPMLEYVTKVSNVAGTSFLGAVKPFVPLISDGMDLISGQTRDTVIEVGINTSLSLERAGTFAIIAMRKGAIDVSKLTLDLDGRLLIDARPLEYGYCVFSIRRADKKSDWGEIPELTKSYANLQNAIRRNIKKEADHALIAFTLATITSPDLIPADANRLVQKAAEKVKTAFRGGPMSTAAGRNAVGGISTELEPLSDLGLYDTPV